ncbi:hypothetical protein [Streptomyces sp. A0592]|uniref:hypothetical protein n=1 Tax=Streptomyces sp. A0592 TaxID=2563099 RepID=UPI00109E65EE|nr:hypothetical protein [Streptomyces sp. A0592]THA80663.1 hypothetical protein E6U81_28045 [Streptomyces sp. A0592]
MNRTGRGAGRGTQTGSDAATGRALAEELLDGRAAAVPSPGAGPDVWLAFADQVRSGAHAGRRLPVPAPPALRLCHPRGWIREAALAEPDAPVELVAVLTTDGAAPVRDRARALIEDALRIHPEATLRAVTPLVLRLGRRRRGDWVLERFEDALRRRAAADTPWWHLPGPSTAPGGTTAPGSAKAPGGTTARVLAELLDCPDRRARQFAVRLALTGPGRADALECARRAAAEPDPATAALWTDAALAVPGSDGDAVIDALIGARIPAVRAAGVTALRRAGRAAEGISHLADASGLVRACARWLVGQDGGDAHGHYRWLVCDPAGPSPYAVTGLAECGRGEDTDLLRTLVAHPVGPVRAAALAGLRRREAVVEDSVLLALLDDPAPSVAREATLGLLPAVRRLDPSYLAARVDVRGPLHVRRTAFRLLRARGGIHALRAAVALIDDWHPRTRATARAAVCACQWHPAQFEGETDTAELAALLKRSAKLFDAYGLALRRSRLGLKT